MPRIDLEVLLSLSCSAITWPRHMLQSNNKRYEAWGLLSTPRALDGTCSLRADVTDKRQNISFVFSIAGLTGSTAPSFTNPKFFSISTKSLVGYIPCKARADTTKGTWNCTSFISTPLTSLYQPVSPLKQLIDAGVFSNPSLFYVGVRDSSVGEVRRTIGASVTTF
ncbi:unnamed protein product [Closterium sp. Yama58-4]|nr:unnamed protein product [Closterium sp. Yama58-4]